MTSGPRIESPHIEPPSYLPSPTRPALRLPPGSCDTHCHIFGPRIRFPFAPHLASIPSDAPKEALFALHDFLGIGRTVIVQSLTHGADHAAMIDAIASRPGACRGVALLPTDVGQAELLRLDKAGFRGVRFNFISGQLDKVEPVESLVAFSRRLADIGWHLQVQADGPLIEAMIPSLRQCATPVVIDHMGRIDPSAGLDQPAFQHLLRLLDDRRIWVKLSGSERISRMGAPYRDAVPFGRKLATDHGDRVLWGLDWPHPGLATGIPDDGALVDLLTKMVPSEHQRLALLVENPERFYGFDPSARALAPGGDGTTPSRP